MNRPETFGPPLWKILHSAAATFPEVPTEGEKVEMRCLIVGLPAIIPCPKCQCNLRSWIISQKINEALKNRFSLFRFFVDMHNDVNQRLGKELFPLDRAMTDYGL